MANLIQFNADKITISGPKVDGGFKITFEVGEYEQVKVAQLLTIPQQTIIRVTVEVEDDQTGRGNN